MNEREVLELILDVVNEADQHVTLRRGLRAALDRRLVALPAAAQADGEEPTVEDCVLRYSRHPGDCREAIADLRAFILASRARPAPSSSPCPDCESKDAFIDALQKRIDSLLSGTVESFVDGVLTIRPHKEVVAVMAEALASVLDEAEAPNYVEMELKRAGSTKAYRLTIQRPEGRSAHALRMEAERQLAELKASPSPAPSHALVEAADALSKAARTIHEEDAADEVEPRARESVLYEALARYEAARASLPAAKREGGA